ncbi:MAG: hypothetical protein KBA31_17910 [Alphaproteobacteria bacterium]|nr:hypothetical protein [Alphaproteobacteria bacterium]
MKTNIVLSTVLALLALPCGAGTASADALNDITEVLRADSTFQACAPLNKISISDGQLTLNMCTDQCFGTLQSARLDDLDFAQTRSVQLPGKSDRAFVEVPCKAKDRCVVMEYGSSFGADCDKSDATKQITTEINVPIARKEADRLRSLLQSVK